MFYTGRYLKALFKGKKTTRVELCSSVSRELRTYAVFVNSMSARCQVLAHTPSRFGVQLAWWGKTEKNPLTLRSSHWAAGWLVRLRLRSEAKFTALSNMWSIYPYQHDLRLSMGSLLLKYALRTVRLGFLAWTLLTDGQRQGWRHLHGLRVHEKEGLEVTEGTEV